NASMPPSANAMRCSLLAIAVHLQYGKERLLRNLDRAHLLHPPLALLLLLEELALPGDVAAVELRRYVLAQRLDSLPGDHVRSDRRLHGDVEELTGDRVLQALDQGATAVVGRSAVN